jgi:RNA polymerase sigma-70 factor (ECF subfamily)
MPLPDRDIDSGEHDRDRVERQWIGQIRTGDEQGFEALFRRYVERLCAFAYSYVRARDVAEEIVEDLFAWIWEHRFTLEVPRAVHAYLYASVRNRAISWLRHARSELAFVEESRLDVTALGDAARPAAADACTHAADLAEALGRALGDMPPRCREVFTLARYHHLTYAEVADVLGISRKTVEIHMSRALAFLRVRLEAWLEG